MRYSVILTTASKKTIELILNMYLLKTIIRRRAAREPRLHKSAVYALQKGIVRNMSHSNFHVILLTDLFTVLEF